MELFFEIGIALLLILLNGLFALSELAMVSVRRARLMVLERKGVPGATVALNLSDDPQRFLPTVQVGMTLVSILTGTFGGARLAARLEPVLAQSAMLAPLAGELSLLIVVLVTTYLTLVLGELVPKQLALRQPEVVASRVARPLQALSRYAAPMIWVLGLSTGLVLRLFGKAHPASSGVTEEELKAVLAEGAQVGLLETEEREMIERLLRLADKPVRAMMTPRNEIAFLDRTDPRRDIVQALKTAQHHRLVVCDGSVDNVVGVVQAKDLLDQLLGGKELSVNDVLRQPMVVPDTISALDALERLKADPLGLALVMDEYGSFEGVVTAADVLKAIVGDATDAQSDTTLGADNIPGSLVVDGMMPVDELKSRLALPDLPAEGSYHTTAGLLLALLRRVPREGDKIVFAGWLFEVQSMDGRRVDRVRASREVLAEG
ncbi:hemolysin family protein [Acidisphaera sp. L21]|jgi:putative hemolysin|uniref:hemolysin family protein n=1 Tax=Acidisphaera sp. L21 TaxID=1641851 RepID=UPI00131CED16|nr:hemolysin family protein [Acidisphaera sp. L21]